jgi:phosphoribosylformylglycinamidine cyclo-ligase
MFEKLGLKIDSPLLGSTVADVLLAPTKIYVKPVLALLRRVQIHAMAHITGGGITENLPRVLPGGCRAAIRKGSWAPPEVFSFLQREGGIPEDEMFRVFNMGVGMMLVTAPHDTEAVLEAFREHGERAWVCGVIERQAGRERLVYV